MRRVTKGGKILVKKDGCAGKLHYSDSMQAAMEIERAGLLRGETLRAYDCKYCGKIHLTSQEKRT